jgi:hypothetical protein
MSDMAEESMTTKDSRGYGKSVASSAFQHERAAINNGGSGG